LRAFPVVYASDVEREAPFEMYVYVDDLGATVQRLADTPAEPLHGIDPV
jgi:hypothetical protein